jgi:hypothetical protein
MLRRAVWNDGSEAFLDTRGLLHLRSANINIPELSIVLTSGPLSGWSADGRYWGDRYFIGDGPLLVPPDDIFATIQQFTRHVK